MNSKALHLQLTARLREIQGRLDRITKDGRHSGKLPADFEEQAVERENDEVLAGLDTGIRNEIASIDKALARLDSGEYGKCEACDKTIGAPRLEALPYATRCVACEGTENTEDKEAI